MSSSVRIAIVAALTLAVPCGAGAQEDLTVQLSLGPLPSEWVDFAVLRPGELRAIFVETSQPAYVAVFEITPDRRVFLRSPVTVHEQLQSVGGWFERVMVDPFRAGSWSPGGRSGFGYLVALASPRPLDLAGGLPQMGTLARWGGTYHYNLRPASLNAWDSVDRLEALVGRGDAAVSVFTYFVESPLPTPRIHVASYSGVTLSVRRRPEPRAGPQSDSSITDRPSRPEFPPEELRGDGSWIGWETFVVLPAADGVREAEPIATPSTAAERRPFLTARERFRQLTQRFVERQWDRGTAGFDDSPAGARNSLRETQDVARRQGREAIRRPAPSREPNISRVRSHAQTARVRSTQSRRKAH